MAGMSSITRNDIITLPNPHLREKSVRVQEINEAVLGLVEEMTDAAVDWENSRPHEISAALAAVQLDRLDRVVIIRSDFDDKEDKGFTALINPEIVKYEGTIDTDYEGCLSVRDVYGKVPRHTKIRVKAINIEGEEVRFKAEGFLARVIQHEIDHTQGIVFIDHIKDNADAFYTLDEKGELQPLDYDEHVKNNHLLWD
jgi:peptide deformylase